MDSTRLGHARAAGRDRRGHRRSFSAGGASVDRVAHFQSPSQPQSQSQSLSLSQSQSRSQSLSQSQSQSHSLSGQLPRQQPSVLSQPLSRRGWNAPVAAETRAYASASGTTTESPRTPYSPNNTTNNNNNNNNNSSKRLAGYQQQQQPAHLYASNASSASSILSSATTARVGSGNAAEVYGFVGWIGTYVAIVFYFFWAYLPDDVLHGWGIFYYPNKYWAVAIPVWLIVAVAYSFVAYHALNLVQTPPLDSKLTYTDKLFRENPELTRSAGNLRVKRFTAGRGANTTSGATAVYDAKRSIVSTELPSARTRTETPASGPSMFTADTIAVDEDDEEQEDVPGRIDPIADLPLERINEILFQRASTSSHMIPPSTNRGRWPHF